jgi:hypothetical protein
VRGDLAGAVARLSPWRSGIACQRHIPCGLTQKVGGLLAYGPDSTNNFVRAATIVVVTHPKVTTGDALHDCCGPIRPSSRQQHSPLDPGAPSLRRGFFAMRHTR